MEMYVTHVHNSTAAPLRLYIRRENNARMDEEFCEENEGD